jgi:hypothetical protein
VGTGIEPRVGTAIPGFGPASGRRPSTAMPGRVTAAAAGTGWDAVRWRGEASVATGRSRSRRPFWRSRRSTAAGCRLARPGARCGSGSGLSARCRERRTGWPDWLAGGASGALPGRAAGRSGRLGDAAAMGAVTTGSDRGATGWATPAGSVPRESGIRGSDRDGSTTGGRAISRPATSTPSPSPAGESRSHGAKNGGGSGRATGSAPT